MQLQTFLPYFCFYLLFFEVIYKQSKPIGIKMKIGLDNNETFQYFTNFMVVEVPTI